ncbi:hypothetical protein OEZ86_000949 [Tetradesmus obliquus]|nr:hypothetical protein OEZ86_000949 [Tetradesmus obliquus]
MQCLTVLFSDPPVPRACCKQDSACTDPYQLPQNVTGCCLEPCSTLLRPATAAAPVLGVCCSWGSTVVTAADGSTSRICCEACSAATGECVSCPAPNAACSIWPTFERGGCCRSSTCLPGWDPSPPPTGQAMKRGTPACCPAAKTCLQYNAAGDLTKRVCCKGTCPLVVNTTTTPPTKRRMCCPWTPQAILGSTPTTFACCPDGTKAQPDGTCCNPFLLCSGPAGTVCCALGTTCNAATGTCAAIPCAAPNTTCAFFPSLLRGDCCPRGACRPVWNPLPAPYGKAANTKACCPEAQRCRKYGANAENNVTYCCNGTCANVLSSTGASVLTCCPYPVQLQAGEVLPEGASYDPATKKCCNFCADYKTGARVCCNSTCAAVVADDLSELLTCCPWTPLEGMGGRGVCCPPNKTLLDYRDLCCPIDRAIYDSSDGDTKPQGYCCSEGSLAVNRSSCCKAVLTCIDAVTNVTTCCDQQQYGCATLSPPTVFPNGPPTQQSPVCCPADRRCQVKTDKWECCDPGQTCVIDSVRLGLDDVRKCVSPGMPGSG